MQTRRNSFGNRRQQRGRGYVTKTRNANTYLRLSKADREFLKEHPKFARQYTALVAATTRRNKRRNTPQERRKLIHNIEMIAKERDD
jgi:hypothetical protein